MLEWSVRPFRKYTLIKLHKYCIGRLQLSIKSAFHVAVGSWNVRDCFIDEITVQPDLQHVTNEYPDRLFN